MFRKNEKYLNYLKIHSIKENLNKWLNIFKTNIHNLNHIQFINKNYFYLFRILKFNFFLNIVKNTILNYIHVLNSWKIISLTWIDWSWKSTICNILKNELWYIYIYWWSNDYILSNTFYSNKLFKKYLLLKIVKLLLIYFENIIKITKAYIFKLRWKNIIFDRNSKINNYAIKPNNLWHKVWNILYKYFIPPDIKKYLY